MKAAIESNRIISMSYMLQMWKKKIALRVIQIPRVISFHMSATCLEIFYMKSRDFWLKSIPAMIFLRNATGVARRRRESSSGNYFWRYSDRRKIWACRRKCKNEYRLGDNWIFSEKRSDRDIKDLPIQRISYRTLLKCIIYRARSEKKKVMELLFSNASSKQ